MSENVNASNASERDRDAGTAIRIIANNDSIARFTPALIDDIATALAAERERTARECWQMAYDRWDRATADAILRRYGVGMRAAERRATQNRIKGSEC